MAWFAHTLRGSSPAAPPGGHGLTCTHAPADAPRLGMTSCPPALDPLPLSYITQQEQRCVLSWFHGWSLAQRQRFLEDLLSKAVPGKVCTLLGQLDALQVQDRPPNIFECQLRLWSQWFESWSEEERNAFLHILEENEPEFVTLLYTGVANTAGKD